MPSSLRFLLLLSLHSVRGQPSLTQVLRPPRHKNCCVSDVCPTWHDLFKVTSSIPWQGTGSLPFPCTHKGLLSCYREIKKARRAMKQSLVDLLSLNFVWEGSKTLENLKHLWAFLLNSAYNLGSGQPWILSLEMLTQRIKLEEWNILSLHKLEQRYFVYEVRNN